MLKIIACLFAVLSAMPEIAMAQATATGSVTARSPPSGSWLSRRLEFPAFCCQPDPKRWASLRSAHPSCCTDGERGGWR